MARTHGVLHWAVRLTLPEEDGLVIREGAVVHDGSTTRLAARSWRASDLQPLTPHVARAASTAHRLVRDGLTARRTPYMVASAEGVHSMLRLARSPKRSLPVVVVSLLPGAAAGEAGLDVFRLSERLFGFAHVMVVPAPQTYDLSSAVGKEFSAFNGATRIYAAGFDPMSDHCKSHPLIFPGDGEGAAELFEDAVAEAVISIHARASVAKSPYEDVAGLSDLLRLGSAADEAHEDDASGGADVPALFRRVDKMSREITDKGDRLKEAERKIDNLEREVEALKNGVMARAPARGAKAAKTATHGDGPPLGSLSKLGDWSERRHAGRLRITKKALKSAKTSQYGDPELVGKVLDALAGTYRDMRLGWAETSDVDAALDALHVDITTTSPRALARNGSRLAVDVKGGYGTADHSVRSNGNPNDPVKCLRVHFAWDDAAGEVVVGSVPAYLG